MASTCILKMIGWYACEPNPHLYTWDLVPHTPSRVITHP
jgi:hypothetical protein